jgi:hypothetical protein
VAGIAALEPRIVMDVTSDVAGLEDPATDRLDSGAWPAPTRRDCGARRKPGDARTPLVRAAPPMRDHSSGSKEQSLERVSVDTTVQPNLRLILRHLARLLRALLRLPATDPRAAKIAFHPA